MEEANNKSWMVLLVDVLTSPGRVFEELAERPFFWPAAVLLTVINLIFALLTLPKLREYSQLMLEKMKEIVPADQVEMLTKTMGPESVTTSTIVSALVAPWILWIVITLLLKLFAAITAKEAPFRKIFAVAIYGYVPAVIGGIINSILIMVTAAENIETATISLAVFSPVQSGFLYHFLTACNPFTWWSLLLWGMGAAMVMRAKHPAGVLVYLFGIWLVFALLVGAAGFLSMPI